MASDLRRLRIAAAIGAALTAASLATPVAAAIVTVTYRGTVASGVDTAGLFGAPGADLSGLPFLSVMKFDTTKGFFESMGAGTTVSATGGTVFGTPSPSLGATFTINGDTQTSDGAYSAQIFSFSFGPGLNADLTHLAHEKFDKVVGGDELIGENRIRFESTGTHGPLPDADLDSPYDIFPAGDILNADFEFSLTKEDAVTHAILSSYDVKGELTPTEITQTVAPVRTCGANGGPCGVPEPSTWSLMIAGFLGLGGALRRRRRQLA
jgi:hypothetical protein